MTAIEAAGDIVEELSNAFGDGSPEIPLTRKGALAIIAEIGQLRARVARAEAREQGVSVEPTPSPTPPAPATPL